MSSPRWYPNIASPSVVVSGERDDLRLGRHRGDPGSGVCATAGHLDVDQRDIRACSLDARYRLIGVSRCASETSISGSRATRSQIASRSGFSSSATRTRITFACPCFIDAKSLPTALDQPLPAHHE